jgi:hypothetical protein
MKSANSIPPIRVQCFIKDHYFLALCKEFVHQYPSLKKNDEPVTLKFSRPLSPQAQRREDGAFSIHHSML